MRTAVLIWALGLICAVFAAAPAQAQFDDEWQRRDGYDAGPVMPLDRILPEVRRSHPGRFYDAEGPFQSPDGQVHYRLKWMTPEGRVVWFDTNARTGRIVGQGGGRHDFEGSGAFDNQGPDDRAMPDNRRNDWRRNRFEGNGDMGVAPDEWQGSAPERGTGPDRGVPDRGGGPDRGNGPDHGNGPDRGWGGDRHRGGWNGEGRHGGPHFWNRGHN
jgi:hypothetical protein